MGETHQEGPVTDGRRPGPSVPGSAVLTPPTGLPAVAPSVPSQRTSPEPNTGAVPATPAPPAPVPTAVCTCGHPVEAHEHYRAGDDCGACGPSVCASFSDRDRPEGLLRRTVRRLRG